MYTSLVSDVIDCYFLLGEGLSDGRTTYVFMVELRRFCAFLCVSVRLHALAKRTLGRSVRLHSLAKRTLGQGAVLRKRSNRFAPVGIGDMHDVD